MYQTTSMSGDPAVYNDNLCRRLSVILRSAVQCVVKFLKEIAQEHSEQRCVLRIGFCQEQTQYTTLDENSRFPVLISY